MKKEYEQALIEWLDDRYWLITHTPKSNEVANRAYYNGAVMAVEYMGYWWIRDENGHHKIGKNK